MNIDHLNKIKQLHFASKFKINDIYFKNVAILVPKEFHK